METEFERRKAAAEALRAKRSDIATRVTDAFLERHPDWVDRYGDLARARGEEDAAFHVDFLAGAILADDPSAFDSYTRWTAGVLGARGIGPEFLVENLEQVLGEALKVVDPSQHAAITALVRAGIDAIGRRGEPSGERTQGESLRDERSLYLQAVRKGSRHNALTVAMEALRRGATVPGIYRDLLQPVQYEVGRLWEQNRMTVAEEHMATAVTQAVMAQLYQHLEIPEETRGRAVITGVQGELHQIGANMVADVLEADGWGARFLGTQLPHRDVLRIIDDHESQLLGVSATILYNLPAAAALIESVRKEFGSGLRIIVGGAAFQGGPGLWRDMGADGYGRDLREAVRVAREAVALET